MQTTGKPIAFRVRQCRTDIEPQRVIGSLSASRVAFGHAEMPAGAGVGRSQLALRRAAGPGDLGLDLAPCAETGIQQSRRLEPRQRLAVIVEMLGLAADRSPCTVPAKPKV